jgi:thiol-disulfide isomerase/thioredoxin
MRAVVQQKPIADHAAELRWLVPIHGFMTWINFFTGASVTFGTMQISSCRVLRVFSLAMAIGFGAAALGKTTGEVAIGSPLRDAVLHGLNGPDRMLSQYLGKPLLINVWASWCGPCRMEMGSLERLAWQTQSRGFAVIGISTDDSETAAKAYLRSANATLNHYLDHALELENMLGANRLPLTVLLDANGRVLGKYYGAWEWDSPQAKEWLNSRLAGRGKQGSK